MADRVSFKTSIYRSLTNSNENKILPQWLDNRGIDGVITEANQFALIKCTPTNTTSTIDLIAGTQSNAGAVIERDLDGFSAIAGAYAVRLTAKLKDGASGTLADNNIRLSINSVELARVYVTATGQKTGEFVWFSHTKDTRWATDGTHDLTITLTAVDPDLEILIEAYTTDA